MEIRANKLPGKRCSRDVLVSKDNYIFHKNNKGYRCSKFKKKHCNARQTVRDNRSYIQTEPHSHENDIEEIEVMSLSNELMERSTQSLLRPKRVFEEVRRK